MKPTDTEMLEIKCPECGQKMILKTSRFGKFYGCIAWPKCKGTHGAHPNGKPMGIPADGETKSARIKAHAWFDSAWKDKFKNRRQAYLWLQELMNLPAEEAHISRFSKEQCEKLVKLLELTPP